FMLAMARGGLEKGKSGKVGKVGKPSNGAVFPTFPALAGFPGLALFPFSQGCGLDQFVQPSVICKALFPLPLPERWPAVLDQDAPDLLVIQALLLFAVR